MMPSLGRASTGTTSSGRRKYTKDLAPDDEEEVVEVTALG